MRITVAVLAVLACFAWSAFGQVSESKARVSATSQAKKKVPKRKPTDLSTSAESLSVENAAGTAPGQEGADGTQSADTVENKAEKVLDPDAAKWEGFRGIKWCTDAAEVSGLTRFAQMENFSAYRRAADPLNVGAAKLEDVRYYFSRDGLYAVQLLAVGAANFDLLKKALDERFGEQGKKDRLGENYAWAHEPGSEYAVKCTMTYDWVTESTVIVLSYAASEKRIQDRLKYKRVNFVVKRSAEAVEDAQEGF